MNVKISKRLRKIADFVRFDTVADIGSDHALLSIYLLQTNRISFAICSDIAQKPLNAGMQNSIQYSLQSKMRFVLSDGLEQIAAEDAKTCIIAGMGGDSIINILSAHIDVAKSFKQLILSPQHNVPSVRKFLHMNKFEITDEVMILEDGKFYTILDCVSVREWATDCCPYEFGKKLVERKDPVLQLFIHSEVEKYGKIDMAALPCLRRKEIEGYLALCKEVLRGYGNS
ncbi:MAG: class I SAM-dependent methyltransferase [Defluviitaleaceae bacterium]|nr:class I SAM-dependent methyltransferase [Defluviitaleaceae bacterium]